MPGVSAIGSRKFEEVSGATIVNAPDRRTARMSISISPSRLARSRRGSRPLSRDRGKFDTDRSRRRSYQFNRARIVREEQAAQPAPARSLYTSAWFQKARDLVEASGARWFVLSSCYGLVAPETEIAPYEYTLNTLGVAERRLWAAKVLDELVPEIRHEDASSCSLARVIVSS